MKPLTENGDARVHTRSMLLFGRLIVTEQFAFCDCVTVPPGHSAESNAPPELLLTLKVKS